LTKVKASSPKSKGGKSPKGKADVKEKAPKKELIPINEDSSAWKVSLEIKTAKDGRVKYPVTASGRFPLLNNARTDNGHGKKQNFLAFEVRGFTPVKGGDDNYVLAVNRNDDLRASQKDVMLSGLKKMMKTRIREINNAVTEKEKAENAAIRKVDREKKANVKSKAEAKQSKAKGKSPGKKSPGKKSPSKK